MKMKMKTNNGSRMSRMKSVRVLGNMDLGTSSQSYGDDDDDSICYCEEGSRMINEAQINGCLSGNNNSEYCIIFKEKLINVYEGCKDKNSNWDNKDKCEIIIQTIY
jgi:hypothetical protein